MSSSGRRLAVSVLLLVVGYAALVPVSPASTVTPFQVRTTTPTTAIVTSTVLSTFRSATAYPARTDWAVTSVSWSPSAPTVGDQVTFSMRITALSSTGPFPQNAEVACMFDSVVWDSGVVSYPGPVGFQYTVTSQKRWTALLGGHTLTCGVATVPAGVDPNHSNNMVTQSFNVSSTPRPIVQTSSITQTSMTESSTASGTEGVLQQNILLLIPILVLAAFGGYFISRRKKTVDRPTEQGLRKVPISNSVHFQFREQDGKTSLEGLVSSGRWFPGVFINKRFYSGVHNGDAFLPGIVSTERFIPGVVTEKGFYPGVATDDGFTPGIIAMGAFVPGIVRARRFVPGIVRNRRFIPGCFTLGRDFVPGRFGEKGFETGLMSGDTFTPGACEMLSPDETQGLGEKGVGVAQEEISEMVGGLPIRGVVVGKFDIPVALEVGLISNQGVIIGGMMPGEHYRTMDPRLDRRLPTKDAAADFRQRLGISDEDRFGIHSGWNSKEKGFGDRMEKEWNNLMQTGFSDSSLFGPVNPDMPGQQSGLGRGIGEALGFLSQGDHGLTDEINGAYNDMMKRLFSGGTGGITEGTDQPSTDKSTDGQKGDDKKDGSVWETIFGVIGAIIGGIAGLGGGFFGAAAGAAGGYQTGKWVYQTGDWAVNQVSGGKKGGGGAKDEDDDTGGRRETGPQGGAGYNPAIMHFYDPGRRTLINWQQSGEWGPGKGEDHSQGAVINFVVTDTGVVPIINYEALSKLAVAGAASHWGQVSLGMNPVTGETRWVSANPLSPEEQRKHQLHDLLVQMYMNPKVGSGGYDSGGAGGKAPQAG